eukprot:TRINITY_DN89631_c0_g1_i1.p1 TRINITY_DN89631_c0_g1~~TRINITY_DN89631_c0_g1_i1.p1  ORF type:complete len:223 (-),score=10.01 TRINITY_DN89631_c0_g1_i1:34-615(-)
MPGIAVRTFVVRIVATHLIAGHAISSECAIGSVMLQTKNHTSMQKPGSLRLFSKREPSIPTSAFARTILTVSSSLIIMGTIVAVFYLLGALLAPTARDVTERPVRTPPQETRETRITQRPQLRQPLCRPSRESSANREQSSASATTAQPSGWPGRNSLRGSNPPCPPSRDTSVSSARRREHSGDPNDDLPQRF